MAEIQVERKRSHTGWLVGLLLLVAVLGAGWYFTMGPGADSVDVGDGPDMQEQAPASSPYAPPPPSPATGPDTGPQVEPGAVTPSRVP